MIATSPEQPAASGEVTFADFLAMSVATVRCHKWMPASGKNAMSSGLTTSLLVRHFLFDVPLAQAMGDWRKPEIIAADHAKAAAITAWASRPSPAGDTFVAKLKQKIAQYAAGRGPAQAWKADANVLVAAVNAFDRDRTPAPAQAPRAVTPPSTPVVSAPPPETAKQVSAAPTAVILAPSGKSVSDVLAFLKDQEKQLLRSSSDGTARAQERIADVVASETNLEAVGRAAAYPGALTIPVALDVDADDSRALDDVLKVVAEVVAEADLAPPVSRPASTSSSTRHPLQVADLERMLDEQIHEFESARQANAVNLERLGMRRDGQGVWSLREELDSTAIVHRAFEEALGQPLKDAVTHASAVVNAPPETSGIFAQMSGLLKTRNADRETREVLATLGKKAVTLFAPAGTDVQALAQTIARDLQALNERDRARKILLAKNSKLRSDARPYVAMRAAIAKLPQSQALAVAALSDNIVEIVRDENVRRQLVTMAHPDEQAPPEMEQAR